MATSKVENMVRVAMLENESVETLKELVTDRFQGENAAQALDNKITKEVGKKVKHGLTMLINPAAIAPNQADNASRAHFEFIDIATGQLQPTLSELTASIAVSQYDGTQPIIITNEIGTIDAQIALQNHVTNLLEIVGGMPPDWKFKLKAPNKNDAFGALTDKSVTKDALLSHIKTFYQVDRNGKVSKELLKQAITVVAGNCRASVLCFADYSARQYCGHDDGVGEVTALPRDYLAMAGGDEARARLLFLTDNVGENTKKSNGLTVLTAKDYIVSCCKLMDNGAKQAEVRKIYSPSAGQLGACVHRLINDDDFFMVEGNLKERLYRGDFDKVMTKYRYNILRELCGLVDKIPKAHIDAVVYYLEHGQTVKQAEKQDDKKEDKPALDLQTIDSLDNKFVKFVVKAALAGDTAAIAKAAALDITHLNNLWLDNLKPQINEL